MSYILIWREDVVKLMAANKTHFKGKQFIVCYIQNTWEKDFVALLDKKQIPYHSFYATAWDNYLEIFHFGRPSFGLLRPPKELLLLAFACLERDAGLARRFEDHSSFHSFTERCPWNAFIFKAF